LAGVRHQAAGTGSPDPTLHGRCFLAAVVSGEPHGHGTGATPVATPPTSQRPYLLRAMHEWMLDNGFTPCLVVDAERPGVQVPRSHVKEGKIVLNISPTAT